MNQQKCLSAQNGKDVRTRTMRSLNNSSSEDTARSELSALNKIVATSALRCLKIFQEMYANEATCDLAATIEIWSDSVSGYSDTYVRRGDAPDRGQCVEVLTGLSLSGQGLSFERVPPDYHYQLYTHLYLVDYMRIKLTLALNKI